MQSILNNSELYFLIFPILILISIGLKGKLDYYFCVVICIYLFLGCAFRKGGYDWENWIRGEEMIGNLIQNGDFLAAILLAKDPFWFLIIFLKIIFFDLENGAIYLICFLSILIKIFSIHNWARGRSFFIAIYGFLLSPTLEFSAMRSALAISFLLLSISVASKKKSYFFLICSILSHQSLMVTYINKLYKCKTMLRWLFYLIFLIIVSFFISDYISLFTVRAEDYIDKKGTINAIIFPLITFIVTLTLITYKSYFKNHSYKLLMTIYAISLGLSYPNVGVSHRILEIGWVLHLYFLCTMLFNSSNSINKEGLILHFILLIIILFLRRILEHDFSHVIF
jgi:hypothetical protein